MKNEKKWAGKPAPPTGDKTMTTTRQLREILFSLDNQKMTVEELRNMLFKVDEQDKEITAEAIQKLEAESK